MKIVFAILILLFAGCGRTALTVEPAKTPKERAVEIAVIKYFIDPSWTIVEVKKEVRYQIYIREHKE